MNPYSRQSLAGVPALTLLNPWGLAITRYGKNVENRGWPPPPNLTRFLIHAGKGSDPDGMAHLRSVGYEDALAHVVPSAIVAVADLNGCCRLAVRGRDCPCGRWAAARQFHWKLTNVVPLPEPVPCRGAQRLWRPAPDVIDAVAEALGLVHWDPLVCAGRRVDDRGRPVGDPHGARFDPRPGETYPAMELRARIYGWKIGPRPADGSAPDAMCPGCGHPTADKRDLIYSLRRST